MRHVVENFSPTCSFVWFLGTPISVGGAECSANWLWRNFFSEMFEPWPIQLLDWKRISSPHKLQLVCIWHFFLVEKQVGEVCQATHFRVVSLTFPSHTQFTSLPVREYSWSIQTHGTQRYHGSWWSIRMNLSDRKTTKTENNITMEAIENCRCTQTSTTS